MTNIMLDLETAALTPDAAIFTIGAVAFTPHDPYLGAEFKMNINLQSCKREMMRVDNRTLQWWDKQDPRAQRGLTHPAPVGLRTALQAFVRWFNEFNRTGPADFDNTRTFIWAGPLNFDLPIIEHALRTQDITPPWHYRNTRCYKTLIDVAYRCGLRKEMWEVEDTGVKHDALDDAKWQAAQAARILQLMKRMELAPAVQPTVYEQGYTNQPIQGPLELVPDIVPLTTTIEEIGNMTRDRGEVFHGDTHLPEVATGEVGETNE